MTHAILLIKILFVYAFIPSAGSYPFSTLPPPIGLVMILGGILAKLKCYTALFSTTLCQMQPLYSSFSKLTGSPKSI